MNEVVEVLDAIEMAQARLDDLARAAMKEEGDAFDDKPWRRIREGLESAEAFLAALPVWIGPGCGCGE